MRLYAKARSKHRNGERRRVRCCGAPGVMGRAGHALPSRVGAHLAGRLWPQQGIEQRGSRGAVQRLLACESGTSWNGADAPGV